MSYYFLYILCPVNVFRYTFVLFLFSILKISMFVLTILSSYIECTELVKLSGYLTWEMFEISCSDF